MASMSIRNIPDEELAALKRIAARNKRSAEAEVRLAISNHVRVSSGKGFGSLLHEKYGGVIDGDDAFPRDKSPAKPVTLR